MDLKLAASGHHLLALYSSERDLDVDGNGRDGGRQGNAQIPPTRDNAAYLDEHPPLLQINMEHALSYLELILETEDEASGVWPDDENKTRHGLVSGNHE